MNQKKDILKSITVLLVICVVIAAALAVVNHFTAPVSAANAALREDEARRAVIPQADSFTQLTGTLPDGVVSGYAALHGGEVCGYVFTAEGKGFGGAISVLCAIGTDGKILSVRTLDVSGETSTLGGKTADESYTSQYAGKDASLAGVDAVSHATITSTAYEGCVRAAFAAYESVKEAEK